ncbi:MAG: hypothetical protein AAGB97_08725 [Dehalococcoidia bacterium]
MAKRIQAINAYRPRINLRPTVQRRQLVSYISDRTGVNEGEISLVLNELRDAAIFFNLQGQGVKLEGLGTYLPKMDISGKLDISHRLDRDIRNALNAPGAFIGEVLNRQNIGKTSDELVAMWNADHHDDPVEE